MRAAVGASGAAGVTGVAVPPLARADASRPPSASPPRRRRRRCLSFPARACLSPFLRARAAIVSATNEVVLAGTVPPLLNAAWAAAVGFIYIGIDELGVDVEQPFRILPLWQLCHLAQANIEEALSSPAMPLSANEHALPECAAAARGFGLARAPGGARR